MAARRRVYVGHLPTHLTFQPYAIAIGQTAIAWNSFQEALRRMFWTFLGNDRIPSINAMWHSLEDDRRQRKLIKAMAETACAHGELPERIHEHVKWLLKEANILSIDRNRVIHTPLTASGTARPSVDHAALHGHTFGRQLKGLDLLVEFRRCRETAITLTDFCIRLDEWMNDPKPAPLPGRPRLPNRGQKSRREVQRRRPRHR